jgi:large subunit ribosomal protein L24
MIRKNDTVQVITGKFKGKTGRVSAVMAERGLALVEKLNMVKRHQKPTQKLPQGGVVEKEAPFQISNLMVYCSKCGKGVRVGVKASKDGKKTRICRKCGESLG